MLHIISITEETDQLNLIRDLFREYTLGLNEDLTFQSVDLELKNPLKKYGPPAGALLLALWNNVACGCIALQPFQQGACEMKRLYVRSQFRKLGIGDQLVKAVMEAAIKQGYKRMILDTLERLQSAVRLYEKYGFEKTAPYYENPLPDVVYMQKELNY